MSGVELLPFLSLDPDTEALDPELQPEDRTSRRQLQSSTVGLRKPLLELPSHCNANVRYPKPSNAADHAFKGCAGGNFYLVKNTAPLAGVSFSIGVGPLSLSGRMLFTPILVVGVTAKLCIDSWKLQFGIDIQTGIRAVVEISASIPKIAK